MTDNERAEKRTDRAIPSAAAAVSPSAIRSLILIVIN